MHLTPCGEPLRPQCEPSLKDSAGRKFKALLKALFFAGPAMKPALAAFSICQIAANWTGIVNNWPNPVFEDCSFSEQLENVPSALHFYVVALEHVMRRVFRMPLISFHMHGILWPKTCNKCPMHMPFQGRCLFSEALKPFIKEVGKFYFHRVMSQKPPSSGAHSSSNRRASVHSNQTSASSLCQSMLNNEGSSSLLRVVLSFTQDLCLTPPVGRYRVHNVFASVFTLCYWYLIFGLLPCCSPLLLINYSFFYVDWSLGPTYLI